MSDFPTYRGKMEYHCLHCGKRYDADNLLYTCPECKGVFLLENTCENELAKTSGKDWQTLFDSRAATRQTALRGIFRFYELLAPVMENDDIVYLGEGNTPIIDAAPALFSKLGVRFAYKNDGQNPSASFKDRGMACAFSYLKQLARKNNWEQVLTVCASTGDTSAAAAQYAAYVGEPLTSVVLLPQGKVTPQQLAQPLGSGATVLEIPGVFDDCMKVVEFLADNFRVALLNSKNAWRILGQESYAYEIAQWYGWQLGGKAVFVPIGNAGNITAIMSGFLKLKKLHIIPELPRLFGVQSSHADPVFRYYDQEENSRRYEAVTVRPSVAQAAMIGNPVSFPRVRHLVEKYLAEGGDFHVMQVEEQEIIEAMLLANSHGHIACTQGGECLAGLLRAKENKLFAADETAILDATAHSLKFSGFQQMYFENTFPSEYEITPKEDFVNHPQQILDMQYKNSKSEAEFIQTAASEIVKKLGLQQK